LRHESLQEAALRLGCRVSQGMLFAKFGRRMTCCFFKHSREVETIGETGLFGDAIDSLLRVL
jgi:hypothetical protein